MGVVLDSSTWITLSGDRLEHAAIIAAAGEAPIYTSVIALGQLSFGVQCFADPVAGAATSA